MWGGSGFEWGFSAHICKLNIITQQVIQISETRYPREAN